MSRIVTYVCHIKNPDWLNRTSAIPGIFIEGKIGINDSIKSKVLESLNQSSYQSVFHKMLNVFLCPCLKQKGKGSYCGQVSLEMGQLNKLSKNFLLQRLWKQGRKPSSLTMESFFPRIPYGDHCLKKKKNLYRLLPEIN